MRSKTKGPHFTAQQRRIICLAAAAISFASELIHLWLLPTQYETFIVYGIIFFLIAVAQGILGAQLLFAPSRRWLTLGIWLNFLIVILYIFTHTVGVPVGLAFLPLPIDVWGIIAALCSLAVAILLFLMRRDLSSSEYLVN